ncbi:MAG: S41 family peptidase [Verrucomicrobiae bacterium]|nr:S41 family peptidase [Verrucomicrobiae bacterium]
MIERVLAVLMLLAVSLGTTPVAGADAGASDPPAPDLKEVLELVRAHLPGVSEAELNRAAVEGLVSRLAGRVQLGGAEAESAANEPVFAGARVLEHDVAWFRVARVAEGLAQELGDSLTRWSASNRLAGVVLDLRFAGGDDYAAAAAVADLFLGDEKLLLDWGKGTARSEKKFSVLRLPVAVLVNGETRGAAEALAALLREVGAGLILGSRTAGRAHTWQEFPLRGGQRLRIAGAPVKLGDGTPLPAEGLKPDIEVTVPAPQERALYENPYGQPGETNLLAAAGEDASAVTNRPARRFRPTEADLVRARREGRSLTNEPPAREPSPSRPVIRDPVLARAVDLIKGLAVVRATRS